MARNGFSQRGDKEGQNNQQKKNETQVIFTYLESTDESK
jgi:hypothetical protein